MENLIIAALLLPRPAVKEGGAPVLLGKAPEGFAAMLEGLSQTGGEASSITIPVLQSGSVAPDISPVPVKEKTAESAPDRESEMKETPLEPATEAPVLMPLVMPESVAPPAQLEQPAAPAPPSAKAPPVPVSSNLPLELAPLSVLSSTQEQTPAQGVSLQTGDQPAGLERQAPAPRASATDLPQSPSTATARGVNLALLEEAGMNILRATGEAELKAFTLRIPAERTELRPSQELPPEHAPVNQTRSAPQTAAAVKIPEAGTFSRNEAAPLSAALHAEDRVRQAHAVRAQVVQDSGTPPAQILQGEPVREILREAILAQSATDQKEPPSPGAAVKQTAPSRTEPRAEQAVASSEASDLPDETTVSQKAQPVARGGAEELRPGPESVPSVRGGVHEPAKNLSLLHTEARAPEIARTLVDQVVRALQLEIKGPVSEMRLRLEPESLGELALRVRVEDGKMQARIEVSQPAVKAVIEGNLPQLRQALASQGIQMDRIDISTQDRSLSRGNSEGSGGRERRRTAKEAGAPLQETSVQNVRMLGYNTIELIM